jgi:indolepyruvate ferredoxin oxidoreductase, alpha subunit
MSEKINQIMAMGDEAVAHGAIDAGVKGVFGYPGTPSTEVFESAAIIIEEKKDGRIARWGANEKVGYEMALGASYAGNRSLVTMKHVGLNVAMDAFVNSGITGVHGGLVALVADDPGMHSSQNEQDSRYLADFSLIPCLEPSTPQETYDFTRQAYDLSEKLSLPILIRVVTRLAHARGPINKTEPAPLVEMGVPFDDPDKKWVLIPANARVQYQKLRDKMPAVIKEISAYNKIEYKDTKIGIIAAGMGRAYLDQLCRTESQLTEYSRFDVLAYPIDNKALKTFANKCDTIFVFEENYPYIEDQLIAFTNESKIHGRRDNTVPMAGELDLLKLRTAFNLELSEAKAKSPINIPNRPPRLCKGCGHSDAFNNIQTAFKNIGVSDPRIFGDIGCYTLGTLPPYNSIQTTVEMGASLGMALGAGHVGMDPVIGIIGDSTFFHSGLTSLVSLAECKGNVNFIVMDNRITAMTGQQKTVAINIIEDIGKAVGLNDNQIHVLKPLPKNNEENVAQLEKVFKHKGPDLIIFRRECIEAFRKGLYQKLYETE